MTDNKSDITRRIENGLYYKEGQDWYFSRYIYPISQRSFLMILFVMLFVLALVSLSNHIKLDNGVQLLPINYIIENPEKYVSQVKSISRNGDSAQVAVAKYYLKDYVRSREEYDVEKRSLESKKRNLKRIKSMSTRKVTNQYRNYTSIINPYSPESRYGDSISRMISIKRIKFQDNDPRSGRAFVTFNSIEKNDKLKDKKVKTTTWVSEIGFNIPSIRSVIKTEGPLRFQVNYYRARPVK